MESLPHRGAFLLPSVQIDTDAGVNLYYVYITLTNNRKIEYFYLVRINYSLSSCDKAL